MQNWVKTLAKTGGFGGYKVIGFRYTNELEESGWHITAWTAQGPIHDYWVSGEQFFTVRVYIPTLAAPTLLLQIGDELPEPVAEVREIVMKAIATWEATAADSNIR